MCLKSAPSLPMYSARRTGLLFGDSQKHRRRRSTMWDTVTDNVVHLTHDLPCLHCGHAPHTYLPCGDSCDCHPLKAS
jgi:hypothetical protein